LTPHSSSAINGLLLAPKDGLKAGSRRIHYTDCIPLFHMGHGLAPMLEVALSQVESQCEERGLVIAGFYHAHDNLRDSHVDVFSQKIADKVGLPCVATSSLLSQIAESQPGSLLVTIDCKKLSANIESACLILQQNIDGDDSH
jgi:hypothetical protein